MWGRGGYGCGMWFGELRNCVVAFEGNFDFCVFEEVGDFSDMR
jgi:hypothetical protein